MLIKLKNKNCKTENRYWAKKKNESQNNDAEWKKPPQKKHTLILFVYKSRKCKHVQTAWQEADQWLLWCGMDGRQEGRLRAGTRHLGWWVSSHLDGGDGFTSVYKSKLSKLGAITMAQWIKAPGESELRLEAYVVKRETQFQKIALWPPMLTKVHACPYIYTWAHEINTTEQTSHCKMCC